MNYKLVRGKRKTLAICITEGEVIVKAPQNAELGRIEAFLSQKSAWIEKKLAEYSRKTDFLSSVIDGDSIMYHGKFLPIVATEKYKRITLSDDALLLPEKYADIQTAPRAITAWYKRIATKELCQTLADISERIGLKYNSYAITNARTKWGSCDGKNNIRLNWRLCMLDDELRAYVIIHELAHTVYHNHSAAFWAEVKKYMPRCAAAKKRLKTFSVLTAMYR